jgi:hypothetical protein
MVLKNISVAATRDRMGHVPGRLHVTKYDRRTQALAFLADRDVPRLVPLLDPDWDDMPEEIEQFLGGYRERLHLSS